MADDLAPRPGEPDWRAVLDQVAVQLEQRGERAWLVGGCLRDALLGRPVRDVDLAVAGDPLALARAVAPTIGPASIAPLREDVVTVRLVLAGQSREAPAQLDLSAPRGSTIRADLRARDFTINALALPLSARDTFLALLPPSGSSRYAADNTAPPRAPAWIDPLGGLADVQVRVLRPATPHALTDDPLRVLRGIRLAAALHLSLASDAEQYMRDASPALTRVAPERIAAELWTLLALPRAPWGLERMLTLGALGVVLPELVAPHVHVSTRPAAATDDLARHGIQTVAALEPALAALMDAAPPDDRVALRQRLAAWYGRPLGRRRSRWQVVRWAALLHGLSASGVPSCLDARPPEEHEAPPITPLMRRMGLSARERSLVRRIVERIPPTDMLTDAVARDERAPQRFFADLGDAGVDVLVVSLACMRARPSAESAAQLALLLPQAAALVRLYLLEPDRVVPPPLVTGAVLVDALGQPPGPWIGRTLAAIRAAQLSGTLATREDALQLARTLLSPPA